MRVEEALALAKSLSRENDEFKVTHTKGVNGYSIKRKVMVTRTNLMTGLPYQEEDDTPLHMSPASETYWSF